MEDEVPITVTYPVENVDELQLEHWLIVVDSMFERGDDDDLIECAMKLGIDRGDPELRRKVARTFLRVAEMKRCGVLLESLRLRDPKSVTGARRQQ